MATSRVSSWQREPASLSARTNRNTTCVVVFAVKDLFSRRYASSATIFGLVTSSGNTSLYLQFIASYRTRRCIYISYCFVECRCGHNVLNTYQRVVGKWVNLLVVAVHYGWFPTTITWEGTYLPIIYIHTNSGIIYAFPVIIIIKRSTSLSLEMSLWVFISVLYRNEADEKKLKCKCVYKFKTFIAALDIPRRYTNENVESCSVGLIGIEIKSETGIIIIGTRGWENSGDRNV